MNSDVVQKVGISDSKHLEKTIPMKYFQPIARALGRAIANRI
jgi:hypothetical protein